ncbi:FMN-binding protein [Eggerthellaceae bacterium 24-137]
MNGVKTTAALGCATMLALGLAGCGASYEGSGSKDAASAEQLAQHTEDPWAAEAAAAGAERAEGNLRDGVYTGYGRGMEGWVSVTLLVNDGRLTCLETAQDGESQSRGGYEAIRDGRYAQMIEAAQGSDIDAVAGATITTAGVKQAVEDALAQAGAAEAAAETTTAEKPAAEDGSNADAAAAQEGESHE